MTAVTAAGVPRQPSLRKRLAARGIDGVTLLVLPGIIFTLVLFIYPCLYGVVDSL
ncbi:MAG: ABC transporter permease, partial [Rhizobiaceae bacterium]